MATSSEYLLHPSRLPQTAFAEADEYLNDAAQLRAEAKVLKAQAKEKEEEAKDFEEYAAKLQAAAEEEREHVQAELDKTLEYHGDVLEHFSLVPDNKKELERLTNNVEEGRAYMHEVIALGEKLIQFRAAELGSSQRIEQNHSTKTLTSGNSTAASSFQYPFSSYASHASPFATIDGRSTWRGRITNLLGNRLSGTFRQVLTDPNTPNEEDKSEESASSDVLQHAVLPPSNVPLALGLEAECMANRHEEKEKGAHVDTVPSVQDNAAIHEVGNEQSPEPPPASAQITNQLNHSAPSPDLTTLEAQRLKRSDTTEEKNAVWNKEKILAMYRELRKDHGGVFEHSIKQARKIIKTEMQQQIESHDQLSKKRKKQLTEYWRMRINVLTQAENTLNPSEPPRASQPANEHKRKGSESALQPASKKHQKVQGLTKGERAAWVNETDMLAKYQAAFTMAKGNEWARRMEARWVVSKELSDLINADTRIPGPRKPDFVAFMNHKMTVMENEEIRKANKAAAQKNQDDSQLTNMPDHYADDMMAEEETESGPSARFSGFNRDYFSEESVDDSQWP